MDTIDKWFIREVLVWRSGAAVAWSVFSLPVIAGFYVSLTTLQPLHPLSWLPVVPTASVTRFSHLGQLCRGPEAKYAQSYEFPISTMFDNFKNKCLVDAMSCTSLPLLQVVIPTIGTRFWLCVSLFSTSSVKVSKKLTGRSWLVPLYENLVLKNMPIINGIKRRPEMKFFTREGGEPNKSKNLFATAYLQIWTVEALASLVGASVREDLFGVVQMSLSDIVSNILNLHENVDKHFKLTEKWACLQRLRRDYNIFSITENKQFLKTDL
ncbi:NDC1-like protein [Mya arenaria]|uniref:NDC1-like protein n=1 Tax=Mya arenaria TaxID=6604 RepID=A0ABY7FYE5_MYAAR|nr:NDC1-like protein [Mya arenaria]